MTMFDPVPTAETKNKQKFSRQALRKETTWET